MLFWKAPPSYWKTLSPREIPTEFSTLLEITTVLLEDQMNFLCSSGKHHNLAERLCLQERSQLNFLLFWRLPPSYWKTLSSIEIPMNFVLFWRVPPSYWKTLSLRKIPNEFYTLLESTTVLLEDPIFKEDTK